MFDINLCQRCVLQMKRADVPQRRHVNWDFIKNLIQTEKKIMKLWMFSIASMNKSHVRRVVEFLHANVSRVVEFLHANFPCM